MAKIRIVAVPSGQAPEWVREQWVGLEIPILEQGINGASTFGVLGGPPERENEDGYAVTLYDAIRALETRSPEAAAWWKTWAKTPLANHISGFTFARNKCQLIR